MLVRILNYIIMFGACAAAIAVGAATGALPLLTFGIGALLAVIWVLIRVEGGYEPQAKDRLGVFFIGVFGGFTRLESLSTVPALILIALGLIVGFVLPAAGVSL